MQGAALGAVMAGPTSSGGAHEGTARPAEILPQEKIEGPAKPLSLCSGKMACYQHTALMPGQF